ncbi:hypothetical protein GPECTOR_22g867 [Gonium pectorale]|uniref:Uncharacterized protein n=1 Tax=Gonium pectorale TaxID=33097 RepID=A0A150GHH1_GONPE|nr:hypothetical protein GPECTOR_22g867 [Gonium pectorale]|eukprot:KXZ49274.1 hypothetical protein GPECTOR_22g867 [Gonium pectorale]
MADAEGVVSYRWEAFNRWCDEYADRHAGMKPKVEDVRRVRGHKTCEYYKRYRAGKAAEQQLAARLQPAALSGRRILAVTAAARRLNTDSARNGGKRSGLDDDSGDEADPLDYEPPEKRRRVNGHARFNARSGSRGRRGASSDEFSDDPSWASGAGSSDDDDSGSGAGHSMGNGVRRGRGGAAGAGGRAQLHSGVHITIVRRDADGRPVQVQTQAAGGFGGGRGPGLGLGGLGPMGGAGELPLFEQRCPGPDAGPHRLRVAPGSGDYGSAGSAGEGGGAARRGRGKYQHWKSAYGEYDEDECDEEDEHHPAEGQERRRNRAGVAVVADEEGEVGSDGLWHPGVAPPEGRAVRSAAPAPAAVSAGQQGQPPAAAEGAAAVPTAAARFVGYTETPLGPVPRYALADAASRAAAAAARRKAKGFGGGRAARLGGGTIATAGAPVLKDPLDFLAQLACEALASPKPQKAEAKDVTMSGPEAPVAPAAEKLDPGQNGGAGSVASGGAVAPGSGDAGDAAAAAVGAVAAAAAVDVKQEPMREQEGTSGSITDIDLASLGNLAANAAAVNMAGVAVAAALFRNQQQQQQQQALQAAGLGLSLTTEVGPAAPLALHGMLPQPLPALPLQLASPQLPAAAPTSGLLPQPPMLWPPMASGVGALLAAPAPLATATAPPPPMLTGAPGLFPGQGMDTSGQLLPMMRLLQMQMQMAAVARPDGLPLSLPSFPGALMPGLPGFPGLPTDPLAGLLQPAAAAAAVAHAASCVPPAAPPPAMDMGLVGAAPVPHGMLTAMPFALQPSR